MTATAIASHARASALRYHQLKRMGRCMCGRRARPGYVKCKRCGAADNERAKRRYARLVALAAGGTSSFLRALAALPAAEFRRAMTAAASAPSGQANHD